MKEERQNYRLPLQVGDYFFFFQAEDGIRDIGVTGVQTCALPISLLGDRGTGRRPRAAGLRPSRRAASRPAADGRGGSLLDARCARCLAPEATPRRRGDRRGGHLVQPCPEQVYSLSNMRTATAVLDSDLTGKARIRDAAMALFAKQGVAATSLRAVARAAGVSPGLVVH